MPAPYLALGLTGPHLVELTSSAALLARWDALPAAFTVLGVERVDGSPPAARTLDSSAVGAALAGQTTRGRFLIVASPQRDHPYNLARRVASLGHLSRGRSGLLVGVRDAYAAPDRATAARARDAARAVRALEQSWPHESIIGDRETGILVRSNEIVHVDIGGEFPIAGPLTVPEPPTGASVIAWSGSADAPDAVDLVIGEGGAVAVAVLGERPPRGTAGVLLRAEAEHSVDDVLTAAERLLAGDFRPLAAGPLRAALGLAAPPPRANGRAAFPVPQPHPSL
ncbi:LLM class flavin-dependent oxidoreductase [Amycolatopsis viridis]|uniref:Alkanesulfonate monooxygenase SsuD/methylene tetrahydromethanopterin reductase-like flavin-dependent oxidoreductase (Luciferase family) n=1 Tax=Amycolatopsis viridis TaxID=185678 RepID=A0ABX0SXZ5_9PSEU|nr:LLM class flavin-dependent oxidoreductase [Amycolatopsis viridis]NIH80210.1 alkanesulfonate monooxygenase SsuD/methylene tetrahydromethanopterin reductase-like flavin-dependent oxidoreductase (luciferase family) [Amycolatopsis viridis]